VSKLSTGIQLRRTRPQSLIDHEQRTTFLHDMIAVIRCLADGRANVGLLRRIPEGPIHRDMMDGLAMTDEGVSLPKGALDISEFANRTNDNDREYEP
jgi:hypothetical protein